MIRVEGNNYSGQDGWHSFMEYEIIPHLSDNYYTVNIKKYIYIVGLPPIPYSTWSSYEDFTVTGSTSKDITRYTFSTALHDYDGNRLVASATLNVPLANNGSAKNVTITAFSSVNGSWGATTDTVLPKLSNGHIKISSVWKDAFDWIRISGTWKRAIVWIKISGVWKKRKITYDRNNDRYTIL